MNIKLIIIIDRHTSHTKSICIISTTTDSLSKLISETMIKWAEESHIADSNLVGAMFHVLHRQYDGVGEVSLLGYW